MGTGEVFAELNYTHNMQAPQYHNKAALMRWATYASVAVALILISSKLTVWLFSDSVSILATLIDSSLDLLASLFNLFAVQQALQPADREHRFGHGKAEPLAGLAQAMFITGSALMLLYQAVRRLMHPQPLEQGITAGLGVMLLSIVLTLGLISFQRYVVKRTGSTAIAADALHYRTDLLVNLSVIVALLLSLYGIVRADAIFALFIAIYVLVSAWRIIRRAVDLLMDHELDDETRAQILDIIHAQPEVMDVVRLRTRSSGTTVFIECELGFPATLTLAGFDRVSQKLKQQLQTRFDDVDVLIYPLPAPQPPV